MNICAEGLSYSVVDPEWFIPDPDPALNFPSSWNDLAKLDFFKEPFEVSASLLTPTLNHIYYMMSRVRNFDPNTWYCRSKQNIQ